MNIEEEVREGYTISKEMKQVWALQMQMAKKLLDVCQKHGIRIWAGGGTLLGTVRHHGFIPWDDDIDMEMLREDYDKLVKLASTEFSAPYFFQCAQTEKHPYPRGHSQLRYDGTTAIIHGGAQDRFHQGIFLDIFVLDGIPEKEEDYEHFAEEIAAAKRRTDDWVLHFRLTTAPRFYLRYVKARICRILHSFNKAFAHYEGTLKRYPDATKVCEIGLIPTAARMRQTGREVSLYQETIYLPFEDMLMPVPVGYDTILTQLYGDYMRPVKAPSIHGGYLALSHDQDYTISIRRIRREILLQTLKKVFRKLTFRS